MDEPMGVDFMNTWETKPAIPRGWRRLQAGELIVEGDYKQHQKVSGGVDIWGECKGLVGGTIDMDGFGYFVTSKYIIIRKEPEEQPKEWVNPWD